AALPLWRAVRAFGALITHAADFEQQRHFGTVGLPAGSFAPGGARQKGLPAVDVPSVCILDPDGDIVRRLRQDGRTRPFEGWPCYHTGLDVFELAGRTVGIVGCAVGAPFAVLVAEELFASGCQLLLSLTSSGQITPSGPTPY